MSNDRIGMIRNFFLKKRKTIFFMITRWFSGLSFSNDRIGMIRSFFLFFFLNKKNFFSYLSHFSGILRIKKYDGMAQIQFLRQIILKYDDVAKYERTH